MNAKQIHRLRKKINKYHLYTVYANPDLHIVVIQIYASNERHAIQKYMKKRLWRDKEYPNSWDDNGYYTEVTHDHGRINVIDEKEFTHYFI